MERHPAVGLLSQRPPQTGHSTPPVPTVSPDLPWSCNGQSTGGTLIPQHRNMQLYGALHQQTETTIPRSRSVLKETGLFFMQNGMSHQQNGALYENGKRNARAESCKLQNRNFYQNIGLFQPQNTTSVPFNVLHRQQTFLNQKENCIGSHAQSEVAFAYTGDLSVCDNVWRQAQTKLDDKSYDHRHLHSRSTQPRIQMPHDSADNVRTSAQAHVKQDSRFVQQAGLQNSNMPYAYSTESALEQRNYVGACGETKSNIPRSEFRQPSVTLSYNSHHQQHQGIPVSNTTRNLQVPRANQQYSLFSDCSVTSHKPHMPGPTESMAVSSHRFTVPSVPLSSNVHRNLPHLPYTTNMYSSSMGYVNPHEGAGSNPHLEKILFGSSRNTQSKKAIHESHVTTHPTTVASYSVNNNSTITQPNLPYSVSQNNATSFYSDGDSCLKPTSYFCNSQLCSSNLDKNRNIPEVNPSIRREDTIHLENQDVERGPYRNSSFLSDSFVKPSQLLNNPVNVEREAMLKGYIPVKDTSTAKTVTECLNSDEKTDSVKCKSLFEQVKNQTFEKAKFKYFRKRVAVEVMGKKEKRVRRKLKKLKHSVHRTTQTEGLLKAATIKKDPDSSNRKDSSNNYTLCSKIQKLPPEGKTQSESSPAPSSALNELWSYVKTITQNKVPDHVIHDALLKLSKGASEGLSADNVFKLLFSLLDLKVDDT